MTPGLVVWARSEGVCAGFMDVQDDFTSVLSRRLSDDAVEQFVRLVRTGRLQPGVRLPSERRMVELLGVSRSSYREAVRILETMGIITVSPGRGTWICADSDRRAVRLGNPWLAMHERDVMDLLELRQILEVRAVALAAERGNDGEFSRIREAQEGIRAAVESGRADDMVNADEAFHLSLAEASGNRVLVSAVADLYRHLEGTRRAMITIPGRPARMNPEHAEIAHAVLSRDPEMASRTMLQHVRRVEREVAAAIAAGRLSMEGGDGGQSRPPIIGK